MDKKKLSDGFAFLVIFYPLAFVASTVYLTVNLLGGVILLLLLQTFWAIIAVDYLLMRQGKKLVG